jgi:hypothetical protein
MSWREESWRNQFGQTSRQSHQSAQKQQQPIQLQHESHLDTKLNQLLAMHRNLTAKLGRPEQQQYDELSDLIDKFKRFLELVAEDSNQQQKQHQNGSVESAAELFFRRNGGNLLQIFYNLSSDMSRMAATLESCVNDDPTNQSTSQLNSLLFGYFSLIVSFTEKSVILNHHNQQLFFITFLLFYFCFFKAV